MVSSEFDVSEPLGASIIYDYLDNLAEGEYDGVPAFSERFNGQRKRTRVALLLQVTELSALQLKVL